MVQRITAGILLTPLLTFYAALMGVLGGVLVTLGFGFPLTLIINQITSTVHLSDVAFGAVKGVVFGAIVSGVGCLRGLQTQQGPSAVGISTTRAVVTSILLIIIADAIFLNPLLFPDVMSDRNLTSSSPCVALKSVMERMSFSKISISRSGAVKCS